LLTNAAIPPTTPQSVSRPYQITSLTVINPAKSMPSDPEGSYNTNNLILIVLITLLRTEKITSLLSGGAGSGKSLRKILGGTKESHQLT
jgi:hypothetical protein